MVRFFFLFDLLFLVNLSYVDLCDVNQYALHLPLDRKRKPGRPKLLSGALARQAEELQKEREPVVIDLSANFRTVASKPRRISKKDAKNSNQLCLSQGLKRKLSPTTRSSKRTKK